MKQFLLKVSYAILILPVFQILLVLELKISKNMPIHVDTLCQWFKIDGDIFDPKYFLKLCFDFVLIIVYLLGLDKLFLGGWSGSVLFVAHSVGSFNE